jgi:hypothetical protein
VVRNSLKLLERLRILRHVDSLARRLLRSLLGGDLAHAPGCHVIPLIARDEERPSEHRHDENGASKTLEYHRFILEINQNECRQ